MFLFVSDFELRISDFLVGALTSRDIGPKSNRQLFKPALEKDVSPIRKRHNRKPLAERKEPYMANQNDQQRTILPIPDPPRTGLIT